jgi:succinyl-CoA synthetase beta subunit
LRHGHAFATKSRALAWQEQAEAILKAPASREELLEMVRTAAMVMVQASFQGALMNVETADSGDDELLTPQQVSEEFGPSLYCVREAIRRNELKPWKPHPKAVRHLRVRRGIARSWAGGKC